MGARFIDYLIADPVRSRRERTAHFVEKVVRLPDCYLVNDTTARDCASDGRPARGRAAGAGFVFCCFNNNYKLTPPVFDLWMRAAARGPRQRAVAAARQCWRRAESAPGSAGAWHRSGRRLVFAPRVAPADHLARQRLADLFLDTLPFNAHVTASDALWAGLPLLTCRGDAFASRVAASVLHAAGLPELVVDNLR